MKSKRTLIIFAFLVITMVDCFASRSSVSKPDSAIHQIHSDISVDDAIQHFNHLSFHEKKMRFKTLKKVLKQYRKDKKAGKDVDSAIILQVILGIFIPPLGVYLHEGEINNKFWISLLLTVLGLIIFSFAGILFLGTLPSIIYALVVILSN